MGKAPPRVTFRKGPLGLTVRLDGKPVGAIKDRRVHGVWQVSVPRLNAATEGGKLFQGKTTFPTLTAAMAAVERHLLTAPNAPT